MYAFDFLDLPLNRILIPQDAVFTESISALPRLTRNPECPCQPRRVTHVKERQAGYSLPCLVEDITWFVPGLDRVMRKVEIDEVVAARYMDLYKNRSRWSRGFKSKRGLHSALVLLCSDHSARRVHVSSPSLWTESRRVVQGNAQGACHQIRF